MQKQTNKKQPRDAKENKNAKLCQLMDWGKLKTIKSENRGNIDWCYEKVEMKAKSSQMKEDKL